MQTLVWIPFTLSVTWFAILVLRGDRFEDWISNDLSRVLNEDKIEFVFVVLLLLALVMREVLRIQKQLNKSNNKRRGGKRTLYFNDEQSTELPNNAIKTTRYTSLTLFPLVFLEYILDIANIYFEVVVFFQVATDWSPTGKHSTYPGVIIAFVGKIMLVLTEEMRRNTEDNLENLKTYTRLATEANTTAEASDQTLGWIKSIHNKDILPGHLIIINDGDQIPIDGVIIGSSESISAPILLKEAALTGETAPQEKFCMDLFGDIQLEGELEDETMTEKELKLMKFLQLYKGLDGHVQCDPPNNFFKQFKGSVLFNNQFTPFNHTNSVFRGSVLEGTDWVLVYTIYTGYETKLGQCFSRTPLKKTPLDISLQNLITKYNFPLLGILVFIAVVFKSFKVGVTAIDLLFVVKEMVINFLHLNGLNNLSTQLTGDIVRIGQCVQMRDDPELSVDVYRTIPEVLGVIDVIVSDKTGTLTENALKLRKVLVSDTMFDLRQGSFEKELNLETSKTGKIREFLEIMALCNNVLPKGSEIYSSNPDDEEFVNSAAMFNCKLALRYRQKGKEMVQISTIWKTDNKYEILANRKFSSDIKYMCTILRGCETGKIKLLLKGADSVVLDLLSDQEKNNWKEKKLGEILANEAADGFRILYWGQKDLTEEEFNSWWAKYGKLIESSVEGDNSPQLKEAWLEIEHGLKFAGATCIEDELQQGAKETLQFIRDCDIKFVMATGDNPRTAVAIWKKLQSHGHVHQSTQFKSSANRGKNVKKQEEPELVQYHYDYDYLTTKDLQSDVVYAKDEIINQLKNFYEKIQVQTPQSPRGDRSADHFTSPNNVNVNNSKIITHKVLVIDGSAMKTITFIKDNQIDKQNYELLRSTLVLYNNVIAAGVSALQKSQLTGMFKESKYTTLSIGDGGNDVPMLQEAHVGIGLESKETDAAGRASDFKTLKFKHLQQMLIHGSQNYFKLSTVYLWNDYKALILALVPYFSRMIQGFEGDPLVPGEIIFICSTLLLAYPLMVYGIFNIPVSAKDLKANPDFYSRHRNNRFNTGKKIQWWLNALLHVAIILTVSEVFLKQENALVRGVVAGQMICLVSNVRLLFERQRGISSLSSWNLLILIACVSSIVLLLPIARINLLYDKQLRIRLSGSTKIPDLSYYDFVIVALAGVLCFIVDYLILWISNEFWLFTKKQDLPATNKQKQN